MCSLTLLAWEPNQTEERLEEGTMEDKAFSCLDALEPISKHVPAIQTLESYPVHVALPLLAGLARSAKNWQETPESAVPKLFWAINVF